MYVGDLDKAEGLDLGKLGNVVIKDAKKYVNNWIK